MLSYFFRSLQPHTILLIQPTRGHESRTYTDYETTQECLEGALSLALRSIDRAINYWPRKACNQCGAQSVHRDSIQGVCARGGD